jgi:L-ribulose-5-phosphate 3-epimerase
MSEVAVVVSNDNKSITPLETIRAIDSAGFKNVFVQWYNQEWQTSQEQQLAYIKKLGMQAIFAHLGYANIGAIWEPNIAGDAVVAGYKKDIAACSENGIPMVIMHLASGRHMPEYSSIGMQRFEELLAFAKTQGVKIALENTRYRGYIEPALATIADKDLGLCYDSGHCHAHFKDEFDFGAVKNRIFALHLHDNNGSGDQHLMPYDGTIDWDKLMQDLKDSNYTSPVTLEILYWNRYLSMSPEDFYKKGYDIAVKLAEQFDSQ